MIMVIMIIYILSFKLKYGIVLFIMIERVVYKIKKLECKRIKLEICNKFIKDLLCVILILL